MIVTYHNHSTYSDGKHTVEQLVEHARALGVDELGVSDHFTLLPGRPTPSWSMHPSLLDDYIHAISEQQTDDGPVMRVGLEVDWFTGQRDAIAHVLADAPLDYVIGSVHYVGSMTVDSHPGPWEELSAVERDDVHRRYWRLVREMAQSGLFDIAAHLDLPKKFGFLPTIDLSREINEALDALAEAGMVVEINTAGWHKPCRDAYPTPDILRACHERGIPLTLSADAHLGDHLLRDFGAAAQRAREAGYTAIARFEKRRIRLEPIDDAAPGHNDGATPGGQDSF